MSSTSTPNDSPASSSSIQPMHNPSQAAHVVVPQAPLGNTTNGKQGMGMKALLAKKMAKSNNPKFVSPTDKLVTPVTQKLNAARQKRFAKGIKPSGNLFSSNELEEQQSESDGELSDSKSPMAPVHGDHNPFE